MRVLTLVMALWVLLVASCASPHLPDGDVEAGRKAFADLGCYTCHAVEGENFPAPVAEPRVPVVLGSKANRKTRTYLAESIIAPSHRLARPQPVSVGDPPHTLEWPKYQNIGTKEESRMGDSNSSMTVEQWLDIVTFLDHCQQN